jgi:hypothetical protein
MKKLLFTLPVVLLLAAGCSSGQSVVKNQPNNTQPTQPTTTQTAPTPTPTQTDDYLVIKEWGVKFKKPAGMSDLKYLVPYNTTANGSVFFSTQQLVNLDKQFNSGKTYCDVDQAPIGSLGRANHLPGPNDKTFPTNLKIGSYYYWFDGPQATCSDNKQVQNLETQQIAPLRDAITTMEVVK